MRPASSLLPALLLLTALPVAAQPSRDQVNQALRQAVEFFTEEVSTEGGYLFSYTSDLSYGRSEQAEGPTRVSIQRAGTPVVGMAYLDVFRDTGHRFYLDAAVQTARALVQGQYCLGGFPYVIEFDPAKRRNFPYRKGGDCSNLDFTTYDDNVSQAAIRLLLRVDHALDFADAEIHEAALFALDGLIHSQYANGAWPQRFKEIPDISADPDLRASYPDSWSREWPRAYYRDHYTLNDNTLADLIDTLLEAARVYDEPRYRAAAERGGQFLIRAQMPEPQPGWAQQYDHQMHPSWARQFEPPAITAGESRSVIGILLTLFHETGDDQYLAPIPRALDYYRSSRLPADAEISERGRRNCPPGEPCLARYYELETNRPIYMTKGTIVRVTNHGDYRDDGYQISYSGADSITHYGMFVNGRWPDQMQVRYDQAKSQGAQPRPVVLSGLSPWDETGPAVQPPSAQQVQDVLDAMDPRGAWTEPGQIGRADRVISVYAAEPMVVTIGGKTYDLPEDETVTVYRGALPPKEEIIHSTTFARNIRLLSAYLAASSN